MNKTIKETFIENMIMNQHGEKIEKVQELMIKGIEEEKKYIENNVVWEVSNGKNAELIEKYGEQLDEVNNLLEDVRFNFLNISLNTVKSKILRHNPIGLKEYDELVGALKKNDKCETCVNTYEEDKGRPVNEARLAELHSREKVLNSKEVKELTQALTNVASVFINVANFDNSDKVNAAELAKQINEALKKSKGSW